MTTLIRKIGRSIQSKLFFSFLFLTLLMSMLISMSAYFITFEIIKERVSSSFSITLDYLRNSVNTELQQIHSLTDYLFVNGVIKEAIQEGTVRTEKAISLNNQANDIIKQYAISHIFKNINGITISGFNGYSLKYALSYSDLPLDNIYVNNKDWEDLIRTSNGKIIWIGLTSRPLYPHRENSPLLSDIILVRSIKSANYSNDIGMMSISINSRAFTELTQTYDMGYPDLTGKSKVFILDNQDNILNTGDDTLDKDQLSLILNAEEAYSSSGYLVPDGDYFAFVRNASEEGWKIIGTIPLSSVMLDNVYIFYISVIAFTLSIIICTLIWFYISSGIFKPLKSLAGTMKKIEKGDTSLRVSVNADDEIGSLSRNFNSMLEQIESLHNQNLDKEIRIKDAEYRALQAQINPHFLYNTLNSMRWMAIMIKAENIKNVIDAFWIITKYSTDNNERYVTVEEEIHIVKQYISLQKIAYRNKFDVVWNVDDGVMSCKCIKFFLQPLVENSIMHGILPEREGIGMIYISIYIEDKLLVFNVYDDGVGMSAETIKAVMNPEYPRPDRKKVGLFNILERINYAYGDECSVDISSEQGHYTNIMIKAPLIRQTDV